MGYIVAKPLVVFFSQMGWRGSVKIHNVSHLDITKLAILRFKIQAGELADCWRVEVHIRSLPLPIRQTINVPENEWGNPDRLIHVPDPCFCRGQTLSRLATVHVVHRFESGNLQVFSWVVTNGFPWMDITNFLHLKNKYLLCGKFVSFLKHLPNIGK
jgi:hypothetical protein